MTMALEQTDDPSEFQRLTAKIAHDIADEIMATRESLASDAELTNAQRLY